MFKVHIIYAAEDGIASFKYGVGAITKGFLGGFSDIANKLKEKEIICRLSLITIN